MPRYGRTTPVAVLSHAALVSGLLLIPSYSFLCAQENTNRSINLPTSKQLIVPAPGDPRRVNSLPISVAASPDGKWVISLNAGYGTAESDYMQSLSVLNTSTGDVQDVPDARVSLHAPQTFFSGLAFSGDGTHVYASLGSMSKPEGDSERATGNAIVVFSFSGGMLKPQSLLKLPLVPLGSGKTTALRTADGGTKGIPFPAAIAVIPGAHERLLVAENLSDSVALLDATTGAIEHTFDLSAGADVPSVYPIALVVSKDGTRAFVALWNSSEVVELDLQHTTIARRVELMKAHAPTAPGSHPCALVLDERAELLYVALSNRDAVAAVRVSNKRHQPELSVAGYFDTRLP